jgi:hypothetical protein
MKLALILSSQNPFFFTFPYNATIIGGINIFIYYILEYINVEVALCHSNRRNKYFIYYILEYIEVVVVLCHSNRRNKHFYK